MNQLKALVDICQHGLSAMLDLVYHHAGGDFGDESLFFFDRQATGGGHRRKYLAVRASSRLRIGRRRLAGFRVPRKT